MKLRIIQTQWFPMCKLLYKFNTPVCYKKDRWMKYLKADNELEQFHNYLFVDNIWRKYWIVVDSFLVRPFVVILLSGTSKFFFIKLLVVEKNNMVGMLDRSRYVQTSNTYHKKRGKICGVGGPTRFCTPPASTLGEPLKDSVRWALLGNTFTVMVLKFWCSCFSLAKI